MFHKFFLDFFEKSRFEVFLFKKKNIEEKVIKKEKIIK